MNQITNVLQIENGSYLCNIYVFLDFVLIFFLFTNSDFMGTTTGMSTELEIIFEGS